MYKQVLSVSLMKLWMLVYLTLVWHCNFWWNVNNALINKLGCLTKVKFIIIQLSLKFPQSIMSISMGLKWGHTDPDRPPVITKLRSDYLSPSEWNIPKKALIVDGQLKSKLPNPHMCQEAAMCRNTTCPHTLNKSLFNRRMYFNLLNLL